MVRGKAYIAKVDSRLVYRRQMRLLRDLANRTRYRAGYFVAMQEFAPDTEFSEETGHLLDGDSPFTDVTYDLNYLIQSGLVELRLPGANRRGELAVIAPSGVSVSLTLGGIDKVTEYGKPLVLRLIEKQPMTFLQVVLVVLTAVMTAFNYWR